jgi:hypothetical protein
MGMHYHIDELQKKPFFSDAQGTGQKTVFNWSKEAVRSKSFLVQDFSRAFVKALHLLPFRFGTKAVCFSLTIL